MVDAEKIDSVADCGDDDQSSAGPVCLECMLPVDPSEYYCVNCGDASNRLTQYIPFVNIQWAVHFWVKMYRQVWSSEISVVGRIFRLFMIVWFVPYVLIELPFTKPWKKNAADTGLQEADSE